MLIKILCKCGKVAVWSYMPADEMNLEDSYSCDDCVPRGCSCNSHPVDGNWKNEDPANWKEDLDEKGREFPCCEWFYNEDGYEREVDCKFLVGGNQCCKNGEIAKCLSSFDKRDCNDFEEAPCKG